MNGTKRSRWMLLGDLLRWKYANADLSNGLLTITLVKEVPEAMKPKSITINKNYDVLEHKAEDTSTKNNKAAKGEW